MHNYRTTEKVIRGAVENKSLLRFQLGDAQLRIFAIVADTAAWPTKSPD